MARPPPPSGILFIQSIPGPRLPAPTPTSSLQQGFLPPHLAAMSAHSLPQDGGFLCPLRCPQPLQTLKQLGGSSQSRPFASFSSQKMTLCPQHTQTLLPPPPSIPSQNQEWELAQATSHSSTPFPSIYHQVPSPLSETNLNAVCLRRSPPPCPQPKHRRRWHGLVQSTLPRFSLCSALLGKFPKCSLPQFPHLKQD